MSLKPAGQKTNQYIMPIVMLYFLMIIELGAIVSNIVRNSEFLSDDILFHRSLSYEFYVRMFLISLSLYCLYRLVRYYYHTYSVDYLLIGYFVFSNITAPHLWYIWQLYLSPLNFYLTIADRSFLWTLNYPELAIITSSWILGFVCLVVFAIRSQEWSFFHIISRIVLGILWIELVLNFVRISINGIFRSIDTSSYYEQYFPTHWYTKLSIFYPFFDGGLFVFTLFPAIAIILVFSTLKPVINTKELRYSKNLWMWFGILFLLVQTIEFLNVLNNLYSLDYIGYLISRWQIVYVILSMLPLVLLLVIMIIFPEALLLSEYQLQKARKLYSVVEKERTKASTGFLDYQSRLEGYIASIPSDLVDKFKEE